MDRKPPQRAPGSIDVSNVPLVGQRVFKMVCKNGHYEETTKPFQMVIPSPDNSQALVFTACRTCWVTFMAEEFTMHMLTDEQAEKLKREAAQDEQLPLFDGQADKAAKAS